MNLHDSKEALSHGSAITKPGGRVCLRDARVRVVRHTFAAARVAPSLLFCIFSNRRIPFGAKLRVPPSRLPFSFLFGLLTATRRRQLLKKSAPRLSVVSLSPFLLSLPSCK